MKILVFVLVVALSGCANRSKPATSPETIITPRGEMPDQFRVKAMYSDHADPLLSRYNDFAEAINVWVWDYARGMSNTKAAAKAEALFEKLSSTEGWSPRPRYEIEQPCEVK